MVVRVEVGRKQETNIKNINWKVASVFGALIAVFAGSSPGTAAETTYPTKPITLTIPFAAGGGADGLGRLVSTRMAEIIGQPILVENRGGASGQIGTGFVARSAPDGYNVLLTASSFITNQYLYKSLPFNPKTSFDPIGVLVRFPLVAVVTPSYPAKSIADLIRIAKAHPGTISVASGGVGAAQDLAARMFMHLTGVKMNMLAYRGGGPAAVDVMAGHVPLLFGDGSSAIRPVRSGLLRALAITGEKRSPLLPNTPTFAESGLDMNIYEWNAMFVPAGTNADVSAKLAATLARALESPHVVQAIADLGGEQLSLGQADAAKFLDKQSETVGKVIHDAGIHAD
jgi:tripartite-type tricarboxylate transporter receptor subunit TctC